MRIVKLYRFIFLSVAVLLTRNICAGTLPRTAALLPPETVLLVQTDNFSQLQTLFEKTDLYKLYKDPVMSKFFDSVRAKIRDNIQKLDDNSIYKMFYNTSVYPQGKAAVALVVNEKTKDANEPPLIFLTQWGDNIDKIKEAFNKLVQKNIDKGGRQKPSEDYRGVSIETMLDEQSVSLCYCFIDDCLIFSFDPDIVKFVVSHIKGADSPSLADDTDYAAAYAATGPYHDLDIFVNIKQVMKMAIADDPKGRTQKTFTNLGVDNVKILSCSVGLLRLSGNASVCKAFLKIEGEKKGLCKLLNCRSAPVKIPSFIPSSAYVATQINLDFKNAFDELVKIVTAFSPQAAAVFFMPLVPTEQQGGETVELKRDVIDHLGSQIISAAYFEQPLSEKVTTPQEISAISITDRSALERSLSLLHNRLTSGRPEAKRELLGHTIYIIEMAGLFPGLVPGARSPMAETSENAPEIKTNFAFTVTDTYLIFGTERAVEQSIRALGGTSAENINSAKWFNTAKSNLPSLVGLTNLRNMRILAQQVWDIVKKSAESKTRTGIGDSSVATGLAIGAAEALVPQVDLDNADYDFKLLPGFDAVSKYFGLLTFFGLSRDDGFYFEMQYLNPGD